ncbi:LytTR family DNA-binding domain-containing protein [uncultured Microscilla sp.]|uniref:LytR/AlgR family response regulator transcription factor n=1 Tax=uncultured Microscilla sp. TaxID=432653 RepID=UPI002622E08A|nr:LytTR family DNA-binding domain-containing protein [uncultured Microscilla sp.]
MKCIIVDDEPLAREGMKLNIQELPSLELIGSFENAMQANDFLSKNEVDLMFLDIQMPEVTGLDFLKTLNLKKPPFVILTTAYPQFALEGYALDVIDYLVKPISMDRFIKAVNKVDYYYKLREQASTDATPAAANTDKTSDSPVGSDNADIEDYIFIRADRKYMKVFFREINYVEGLKDYVIVYTDTQKIVTAMNIKTIEGQLPSNLFIRVSKSYIINMQHIKAVDNNFVTIKEKEVPIGKAFKDNFLNNIVNKRVLKR